MVAGPALELRSLDVGRYEAFTVATPVFWRRRPEIVLDYFLAIRLLGSSAFLATQDEEVCRGVHGRDSSIVCVVSNRMNNQSLAPDTMMSMERWHIALHFLERGQRIIHSGADMRFTRPLQCMYAACGEVDAAFDGSVDRRRRQVSHFTPDLLVLFPTQRSIAFVRRTLAALEAPTHAGLSPALSSPLLLPHRKFLMGPGQQDLLLDVLWSTLYGRQLSIRKSTLARHAIAGFPPNAPLRDGPERMALGPIDTCEALGGVVLRSAGLVALMALHGLVRAAYAPCERCSAFSVARTHVLHCMKKSPACLDLRQCKCLASPRSSTATLDERMHGIASRMRDMLPCAGGAAAAMPMKDSAGQASWKWRWNSSACARY